MASVTLENVWKIYNHGQKNAVEAVRDVNLTVQDGEFIAFLGPSGCGKTSILRMIAGLEHISRGAIRIGDIVVNNLSPDQRNIAMAFETYALYPHMNVRENMSFCLRARNWETEKIDTRVNEVTQALHIEHLLEKRPSELPGGQQQLVSVARAMIRQPNVFLLDEPFSHSDASQRVIIRTEIKRLVNKTHTTTILVTHDQHEAVAMADRIMVMNFAEVQQVGTAADLFHKPANMFVAGFVGEPAINFIKCKYAKTSEQVSLVCSEMLGCFPISQEAAQAIEAAGVDEVMVGIRPQEFKVTTSDKGYIQGSVSFFEFLGEEGHLIVDSNEGQVTAVTDPYLDVKEGDNVGLIVERSEIFVFDPKTEKAICHGV